jgi:hypothetical protein
MAESNLSEIETIARDPQAEVIYDEAGAGSEGCWVHLRLIPDVARGRESRGGSPRPRMQHVDGPAHVQPFPGPLSESGARVEIEPLRGVLRPDRSGRIGGHRRRWRYLRQWAAVRAQELERSVDPTLEMVALFVHRPVMTATE